MYRAHNLHVLLTVPLIHSEEGHIGHIPGQVLNVPTITTKAVSDDGFVLEERLAFQLGHANLFGLAPLDLLTSVDLLEAVKGRHRIKGQILNGLSPSYSDQCYSH